ncbi:MAG: TRAP transporter large permease [Xanthomonadales bacterium]|nr:TRAP transporter large permease [Xanthomonadales bacterium]
MTTFGLVILVLALLALRQNLLVVLGVVLVYVYWAVGEDALSFILLDGWHALNKEVLLSIPLFILSGQIMSRGSMAERLVRFVRELTGPIPGGMAIATVLACALFAAISGSSTVTLLAVGSVMYPALLKAGYSKSFSLGALCAAGTLGIVVPPSIPLILYGVMTRTSITDLFLAGIGPALLLTALMSLYAVIANRDRRGGSWKLAALLDAGRKGMWSLLMPVLILGGIYSGHFTATESAAVAVVYAFVVEVFIHRELSARKVYDVFAETTQLLGSLFPVLMLAVSLNVLLTYQQVPVAVVQWFSQFFDSSTSFLVVTNIFLLMVGTVMDIGSAVLILSPMLEPIASAQGIDPVHFGIITIVNLEIGYLTPPFGLNLIVAMSAFREGFWDICKSVVPFLLLMLLGLVVVTFVPRLSLFLIQ